MGKGGQGKGAGIRAWPRVVTAADAPQQEKLPATSLPVDQKEEPFLLKHAIMEASQWTRTVVPNAGSRSLKALVQVVLSDQEVAESISSLTPKYATPLQHGQVAEIDVRVLRMSGDSAFVGTVDSDMTVAELKQRLQAETGIKIGWQVLLLGDGREMESEQKLVTYVQSGDTLDIQLQVVKFRDLCRSACSGDTHGATLSLLEEAQRGDYAVACVAGYNLASKGPAEEKALSFQLLVRTLPLEDGCKLVANAMEAMLHHAAIELARIFHESLESKECLRSACGSDGLGHRLFQHLEQVKFPPRPVPYTGPQIKLTKRDPIAVAREHLAQYMDFAMSLPANWHYKTLTPMAEIADLGAHLTREAQNAATMLNIDPTQQIRVSRCLKWAFVSNSDAPLLAVFLEPSRLFAEKNDEMSEADIFCGIAEPSWIAAEFTRMALECAARLSCRGHKRALAAACWCAGHKDAVVREQALEVLRCVAQVGDLPAIQSMLLNWWGPDCHASRIGREITDFCTKGPEI